MWGEWLTTEEGRDVGAQNPQEAYCVYAVGDEVDESDAGQGLKLEQEGVEVFESIRVSKKWDEQHLWVKALVGRLLSERRIRHRCFDLWAYDSSGTLTN